MEIYLVRHTRVDIAPGICYGQSDVGCLPGLMEEAEQVQQKLGNLSQCIIYSSPLQRCVRLTEKPTDQFKTDSRLMELHFGDWEMQSWNDLEGPHLQHWMQDFVHVACPNGESYLDLFQRCRAFLQEKAQIHPDETLVLVTHGGVIRAMVSDVLGLPLENSFRLEFGYGSVSLVTLNQEAGQVKFLNR